MASEKAKTPRQGAEHREARRIASHARFKSPLNRPEAPPSSRRGRAPATLPPPPFESEAEVSGLEWWLDAHMGLASDLLCLGQLLDALPEGSAHSETVRRLAAEAEDVRDALYELYCDAADPRMAPLAARGAALEQHVRARYAWCTRVVSLLSGISNGLRDEEGPDWSAVKAGFRETAERYAGPSDALRDAIKGLLIDFSSPIEPLRNLPSDLEQLFASGEALHTMLAKRFADASVPSSAARG